MTATPNTAALPADVIAVPGGFKTRAGANGPAVFSRPGSKRYLEQVKRRIAWCALQEAFARGAAKRAELRILALPAVGSA